MKQYCAILLLRIQVAVGMSWIIFFFSFFAGIIWLCWVQFCFITFIIRSQYSNQTPDHHHYHIRSVLPVGRCWISTVQVSGCYCFRSFCNHFSSCPRLPSIFSFLFFPSTVSSRTLILLFYNIVHLCSIPLQEWIPNYSISFARTSSLFST